MRLASVREFRAQLSGMIDGDDPVLITRHGKATAILLPLGDSSDLPVELRHELIRRLGERIAGQLQEAGVTEEDILSDFEEHRAHRRGQ